MINVKEVKEKALKWWNDGSFLKSYLQGVDFFPKDIPKIGQIDVSKIHETYNEVMKIQDELRANIKLGYSIEENEVNYRSIGKNKFITRIYINSNEEFIKLIGKERELKKFNENVSLIIATIPELENWVKANPLEIINYSSSWENILKVCSYFKSEHQPNLYYIRELPINVHTKFIEQNKSIISSLLDFLIQEKINPLEKDFHLRYNLKNKEKLIRVRILCPDLALKYTYNDFSIRLSDFISYEISSQNIFIAENEMNFLTLPCKRNSIAIWSGGGFQISYLANIDWLKGKQIYYWGDIDAAGLSILSQLRTYYPSAQSILMDRATFEKYYENGKCEKTISAKLLKGLTLEELNLFNYLNENKLRLEQEKIPQFEIQNIMS